MATTSAEAIARLTSLPGISTARVLADARSTALASGDTLPVAAPLAAIAELRRGTTVAVHGSTSLLLALLAEATCSGSWAAAAGMPGLGLAAAAELGVDLSRLALLPRPRATELPTVLGALLDGVDLVVLGPAVCRDVSPALARRLSQRARNRGAVLLTTGTWPAVDLEVRAEPGHWSGGALDGHGRLTHRDTVIHRRGRGDAARPGILALHLPGPTGAPAPAPAGHDTMPGPLSVVS